MALGNPSRYRSEGLACCPCCPYAPLYSRDTSCGLKGVESRVQITLSRALMLLIVATVFLGLLGVMNTRFYFEVIKALQICIGVARGLHYLHTGVKHTIIYRDVKLTNILLGENWEAKLADFGLCKKGPPSLSKALIRIDSVVKGTVGYLDPAYLRTRQLTDKTDVYCFGVVLFEVLCARRSVDMESEREQSMAVWAPACVEDGTINQIIDPYLIGKIAPECFKIYVDIATSCMREDNLERPAIGEVEIGLEHTLELQEYADAAMRIDDVGSGSDQ